MKLIELKAQLEWLLNQSSDNANLEVRIPTNLPSIGPISTTGVIDIIGGFDWESGMLLIIPENKLTIKNE